MGEYVQRVKQKPSRELHIDKANFNRVKQNCTLIVTVNMFIDLKITVSER